MLTVTEVIDQARVQLQDASKTTWSDAVLVDYLNDARSALYQVRPRVYETTETLALADGPRQTLPYGSNQLFDVLENITHIGRRAISLVDRELLNRSRPRWRGEEPTNEIVHYTYDELQPTIFEVYPPALAGTEIMASFAKPPVKLSIADYSTAVQLTAEGDLATALCHFVQGKAYEKISDASPEAGVKRGEQMEAFATLVGVESTANQTTNPNNTRLSGMPRSAK